MVQTFCVGEIPFFFFDGTSNCFLIKSSTKRALMLLDFIWWTLGHQFRQNFQMTRRLLVPRETLSWRRQLMILRWGFERDEGTDHQWILKGKMVWPSVNIEREFSLYHQWIFCMQVNTAKAEAEMAYGLQASKVQARIKEEEMQVTFPR